MKKRKRNRKQPFQLTTVPRHGARKGQTRPKKVPRTKKGREHAKTGGEKSGFGHKIWRLRRERAFKNIKKIIKNVESVEAAWKEGLVFWSVGERSSLPKGRQSIVRKKRRSRGWPNEQDDQRVVDQNIEHLALGGKEERVRMADIGYLAAA